MAITFVSELAFEIEGGASTENVNLPGTLAEDDLVIVALASDANITLPQSAGVTTADYTVVSDSGSAPGSQHAYKFMGATPDTTVTIDQIFGTKIAGVCQVWRGVDTGTPIDNTAAVATGSSLDPNPPAYTTVTDGALRIILGFMKNDDAATGASAPTGYEADFLASDTGQASTSVGATVLIASKIAATAGAEDPDAFVTPAGDFWRAYHFALRPAAGGGGGDFQAAWARNSNIMIGGAP